MMLVTMDRSRCPHHPVGCEGCLGEFLQSGQLPDRGCLTGALDDGRSEVTVRIQSGDSYGTLVIGPENREEIIYHGWMNFAELHPELFPDFKRPGARCGRSDPTQKPTV